MGDADAAAEGQESSDPKVAAMDWDEMTLRTADGREFGRTLVWELPSRAKAAWATLGNGGARGVDYAAGRVYLRGGVPEVRVERCTNNPDAWRVTTAEGGAYCGALRRHGDAYVLEDAGILTKTEARDVANLWSGTLAWAVCPDDPPPAPSDPAPPPPAGAGPRPPVVERVDWTAKTATVDGVAYTLRPDVTYVPDGWRVYTGAGVDCVGPLLPPGKPILGVRDCGRPTIRALQRVWYAPGSVLAGGSVERVDYAVGTLQVKGGLGYKLRRLAIDDWRLCASDGTGLEAWLGPTGTGLEVDAGTLPEWRALATDLAGVWAALPEHCRLPTADEPEVAHIRHDGRVSCGESWYTVTAQSGGWEVHRGEPHLGQRLGFVKAYGATCSLDMGAEENRGMDGCRDSSHALRRLRAVVDAWRYHQALPPALPAESLPSPEVATTKLPEPKAEAPREPEVVVSADRTTATTGGVSFRLRPQGSGVVLVYAVVDDRGKERPLGGFDAHVAYPSLPQYARTLEQVAAAYRALPPPAALGVEAPGADEPETKEASATTLTVGVVGRDGSYSASDNHADRSTATQVLQAVAAAARVAEEAAVRVLNDDWSEGWCDGTKWRLAWSGPTAKVYSASGAFVGKIDRVGGAELDGRWSPGGSFEYALRALAVAAAVKTKEESMATKTDAKDEGPSALAQFGRDAEAAAWRTAGSQYVKAVKEPLVALIARHLGPDDPSLRAKVAAFVDSPVGEALLAALLSAGLGFVPGMGGVPAKMSQELRVRAMAGGADLALDVLAAPLREVFALYLRDLPVEVAGALPDGARIAVTPIREGVAVGAEKHKP